jgi:hypothetical protein
MTWKHWTLLTGRLSGRRMFTSTVTLTMYTSQIDLMETLPNKPSANSALMPLNFTVKC